ncbi:hypothetical protein L9F63_012595, partial [Diploptera punctata]
APIKALCTERYLDWKSKFSTLGLKCLEITGDTNEFDINRLTNYHLLLTTPEKWDSITRKWKDNSLMVQMVKLFLIDEVHLLNEEKRGPTLEVVVSRMKTVQEVITGDESEFSKIRFMAISATIPNIEDVARWLGTSLDHPATYFKMSEDMRPVKLKKIVLGYSRPVGLSQFRFEMSMSYKLRGILFKYANGKPTLIFCSTRKGVEQTCSTLAQQITFNFKPEQKQRLTEIALTLNENKLKDYIMTGVGYHHAGMLKEDRQTVEYLFREGLLPVLVTTSTLAMGVNLPAHLVIIKSTQHYVNGAYHEYSETQILQMIGRAGRPQFDNSAVAIIMTQESRRNHYENLVSGNEPIESNLHKHLVEHLNSEVVLHTVTDIGYAMEWIRSTFLYVRALKNPTHYGISAKCNRKNIESNLQDMCNRELNALASANLIVMDVMDIKPTDDGILMARYYLRLGTMKAFSKVKGNETLENIVHVVAASPEFSEIQLRVSEKKNLNLLNNSKDYKCIRFPLPTRITTKELKVNCLIQALLGCLQIYEPSLKQDMLQISWIGQRVANGLVQYLRLHPCYKALVNAVTLAKCFHCKLWENSPYVSRQLKGIGAALSTMLVASNKTTFQSIINSNPRDLESIINRPPPMGDNLIDAVSHLPQYDLNLDTENYETTVKLNIHISISNHELVDQKSTAGTNHWVMLIVGDSNNKCHSIERFKDDKLMREEASRWSVEIKDSCDIKEVYVDLISEQWAGLDVHATITLNETHLTLKGKNFHGTTANAQSAKGTKSKEDSVGKKTARSSIIEQIREISEKRLKIIPTITLQKFAFTPKRKMKQTGHNENENNQNIINSDTNDTYQNIQEHSQNGSQNIRSIDNCMEDEIFEKPLRKDSYTKVDEIRNMSFLNSNTRTMENFGDTKLDDNGNGDSGSNGILSENTHDSFITTDAFANRFSSKDRNFNNSATTYTNGIYSQMRMSSDNLLLKYNQVKNKVSDCVDRIQYDENEPNFSLTRTLDRNVSNIYPHRNTPQIKSCWNEERILNSDAFLKSFDLKSDEHLEVEKTVMQEEKNNSEDTSTTGEFSDVNNSVKIFSFPDVMNTEPEVTKLPRTLPKHYYPIFNKIPCCITQDTTECHEASQKETSQQTERQNFENSLNLNRASEKIMLYETKINSQETNHASKVINNKNLKNNEELTKYSYSIKTKLQDNLENQKGVEQIPELENRAFRIEEMENANAYPTANFNLIEDFDAFFNEILEQNVGKQDCNSNDNSNIIQSQVINKNLMKHDMSLGNMAGNEQMDDKSQIKTKLITHQHIDLKLNTNSSSYNNVKNEFCKNISPEQLDLREKSQNEVMSIVNPAIMDPYTEMRNKQFDYLPNITLQTHSVSSIGNSYANALSTVKMINDEDTSFDNQNAFKRKSVEDNIPLLLEERHTSQSRINTGNGKQNLSPEGISENEQELYICRNSPSKYEFQDFGNKSPFANKHCSQISDIFVSKRNSKSLRLEDTSQFKINEHSYNSTFRKRPMTRKNSIDSLPYKQTLDSESVKNEVIDNSLTNYEKLCISYSQSERLNSSPIHQKFLSTLPTKQESQTYKVTNTNSQYHKTPRAVKDDFYSHCNGYAELLPESRNNYRIINSAIQLSDTDSYNEVQTEISKTFTQPDYHTQFKCKSQIGENIDDYNKIYHFKDPRTYSTKVKSRENFKQFSPFKSLVAEPAKNITNFNEQLYDDLKEVQCEQKICCTKAKQKENFTQFATLESKTQLETIPTNADPQSEEQNIPNQLLHFDLFPISHKQTKMPIYLKNTYANQKSAQTRHKNTLWERYLQFKEDPNANDAFSQNESVCFSNNEKYYRSESPEHCDSRYGKTSSQKLMEKEHYIQNNSGIDDIENSITNISMEYQQQLARELTESNNTRVLSFPQSNFYNYSQQSTQIVTDSSNKSTGETLEITDSNNGNVSYKSSFLSNASPPAKRKRDNFNSNQNTFLQRSISSLNADLPAQRYELQKQRKFIRY